MRKILVILCLFYSMSAFAAIKEQEVSYEGDGIKMKGFVAYDDRIQGKRPGVLVVHEWWGHNEYARQRVRMLAELGYTAFALDMYGDGKNAEHPKDAAEMSKAVFANMEGAKKRFVAAKTWLEHSPTTSDQIAAIGYCFGGGIALHMARMGVNLKGVVSFHGNLTTPKPAEPGAIKSKILVLNGADDPFNKPETVAAFEREMKNAKADYKVINYPGAKHSFTNPDADNYGKQFDMPLAYHNHADHESWVEMQTFLKSLFK